LIGGLVTGMTYPDASIEFTKLVEGGGEQTYLTYKLKDVIISSYSSSGGGSAQGDSVPVDSISLNFEELEVSYTPLDVDGNPTGDPVAHTWLVNPPEPQ
jgi:type VI protein secretion system component Hcp